MSFHRRPLLGSGGQPATVMTELSRDIYRVGSAVLDLILPPQCLKCDVIVESSGALCLPCWREINFTSPPWCHACGLVLEFDPGADGLCAACAGHLPIFERARSVFAYDKNSRALVLAFKNRDRTDIAPAYARWLARVGTDLLSDADIIVPVPLHWSRLYWRRFNQAALLATALGNEAGVEVIPDLLVRRRRTLSLGSMSPSRRRRTLKGVFAVRQSYGERVKGRRVLLVDDVLTTGATVQGCARSLLQAGAGAVDVLTLARVMRPLPSHA